MWPDEHPRRKTGPGMLKHPAGPCYKNPRFRCGKLPRQCNTAQDLRPTHLLGMIGSQRCSTTQRFDIKTVTYAAAASATRALHRNRLIGAAGEFRPVRAARGAEALSKNCRSEFCSCDACVAVDAQHRVPILGGHATATQASPLQGTRRQWPRKSAAARAVNFRLRDRRLPRRGRCQRRLARKSFCAFERQSAQKELWKSRQNRSFCFRFLGLFEHF